jgi:hypothetical protein
MSPRSILMNEEDSKKSHTSNNDEGDEALSSMGLGYSTINRHVDQIPEMEPLRDTAPLRRESFVQAFAQSNGPPQMIVLCLLIALAFGSTVGVVPAVMTDRYAHLLHNYTDSCSSSSSSHAHSVPPKACVDAASDAQNGVAMEQLITNTLTFCTSSYVGALSDEYGRKSTL